VSEVLFAFFALPATSPLFRYYLILSCCELCSHSFFY